MGIRPRKQIVRNAEYYEELVRDHAWHNGHVLLSVHHYPKQAGMSISYLQDRAKIAKALASARRMLSEVVRLKDKPEHREQYGQVWRRDPNEELQDGDAARRFDASFLAQLMQPALWDTFAAFGNRTDANKLRKVLDDPYFSHHHNQIRHILQRIDAGDAGPTNPAIRSFTALTGPKEQKPKKTAD